jgi:phosphoesterase RecJ-like protein
LNGFLNSAEDIRKLLPAFMQEVRAARGVLIGTHVNPDGDAIGSALAVSHILDQLEVENEVLCSDPAPYYLQFLPGADRIRQAPQGEGHSLAVIVDLEARNRLGSVGKYFDKVPRAIVIDHHIPIEAPGDLRIVCPRCPATASIILDLFRDSDVVISPKVADCLLTGILTDTGSFRFPNTDAHSLHSAGYLLECGADLARVTREVYMQKELPAIVLTAHAVLRMKTDCGGRLAWATLPFSLFESLNAEEQFTEGIVNELLSVKGVMIAAILREGKPGKIRGSLRSLGSYDVAAVAREFGGGGHANAAGVSFSSSLEEAEEDLVEALKRCLESS